MNAKHARRARRGGTVLVGVLALSVVSGTALAYWTTTGTGQGAAVAGSMQPPVVSAGTVSTGQLYPGATGAAAGDLVVVASNPNPFPVTVVLSASGAAVTGCTTPAVNFAGGSFDLAVGDTDVTKTLSKTVSMGTASSSDCQGKTLTIPLTTSTTSR